MIWSMLLEAVSAILANRLRSFLTMLGIVIGVSAVIIMLAVGAGVQDQVKRSISALGSNTLVVQNGATNTGAVRGAQGSAASLTLDDAQSISNLDSVIYVAPMLQSFGQLAYASKNWNTQISATTPDYFKIQKWDVDVGAAFTEEDVSAAKPVVLLGRTVVNQLFGNEMPVGKIMRINRRPFQVVGILASKGQNMAGRDQDDAVVMPIRAAQQRLSSSALHGRVGFIQVEATSAEKVDQAQSEIEALLRNRHRIREGQDDDFMVRNLTAIAETAQASSAAMTFMLGAIGSVSLLVGGIGIMNIMLVSVTERTREIGLRKAVGATQSAVLWQFLLEAVVISLVGCFIGLAIGFAGATAVSRFAGLSAIVTSSSVIASVLVSSGVGLFFGWYPARRAAALDPIEALRYQ